MPQISSRFALVRSIAFSIQSLSVVAITAAGVLINTTTAPAQEPVPKISFARQVLPILSSRCFVCHGPDTHDPDMLRLDSYDNATEDRDGSKAIDPGSVDSSTLVIRIHDADDPMPPADSEKQLTEAEKEILTRWVEQGGAYDQHWSFVPPIKIDPPTGPVTQTRQAIDDFVAAGLQQRGLEFAPEADRNTLARRAALVLTGLPPEPEELVEFLADQEPGSYERYVDRLLASPRFGEHQARYWLDAVRYGDTHGLHLDNRRGIYPYRDWVVSAFNDNLPLNDFLTWQIAGDLLPEPTLPQLVATGFVRMNPTTSEGGAIPDEFQAKNNFDRTEALGTVLLGMTFSCARCHSHKYDPISQTEYYRLFAFFNSTAEPPMDSNAYAFGPVAEVPADQAAWARWNTLVEQSELLLSQNQLAQNQNAGNEVDRINFAKSTQSWSASDWKITQPVNRELQTPAPDAWAAIDKLPGATDRPLPTDDQAIWISCQVNVPVDQTLWLAGRVGGEIEVQVDGQGLPLEIAAKGEIVSLYRLPLTAGSHQLVMKCSGDGSGAMLEARLINAWQKLAETGDESRVDLTDKLLILAEGRVAAESDAQQAGQAIELAQQLMLEKKSFTTTLIAQELPNPRETRILRRGEYDLPTGDPLSPGVPVVMGTLPEGVPANRLGLAAWITSPNHPLVTRVLVNGIWQRTYGHGLVRTPEDFGLQGEQATHPELLDWLAVELRESGWNLKEMLRAMVTSRTFRQESRMRSEVEDPENRLFARGPRHRLDAEVLRDIGLWAGDLLDPHMGGEGVKPYQPDGMWEALAHPASNTRVYAQDQGTRLYRRSLYVYWKRTSPHPMMTLFDAPDRESSCVRRTRSTTALQSLAMFNETQRVEMSRSVAGRLLRECADDESRLDRLFSLLASREPSEREREVCLQLLDQMRKRYADSEDEARALVEVGDAPNVSEFPVAEQAAWTQVTSTVLASDLALMLY